MKENPFSSENAFWSYAAQQYNALRAFDDGDDPELSAEIAKWKRILDEELARREEGKGAD